MDVVERPDDAWRRRPVLAAGLRLLILLVPIVASLVVTATVRGLMPAPRPGEARVAWLVALVALGVGTALGVERLGRRLAPLIMLLKLSMLFPDRAPSRFAVARQAGSVKRLKARLEELGERPEELEESSSAATILALATALQAHDRRTRGHAERVRIFTDLLARELRLPEEDCYRLRWAALLHDIGKLTVKAGILNKPGKLDADEWEILRAHPAEGARIAAPLLAWLGPWGGAIAEHHERFDGAGYPAGRSGDAISLAGRLVAVADAYDTMTAARSYKRPMSVLAARKELAACASGQFDPAVVRAFFNISLPVLLWKTGPASLLAQLSLLARLREIGQPIAAAAQGIAATTVVAGVTAMAMVGSAAAARPGPADTAWSTTRHGAVGSPASATNGPSSHRSPMPTGSGPSLAPSPPPSPSPTGSPSAGHTLPVPTVSPLPSLSPLPTLTPVPTLTTIPTLTPIPKVSTPPVPTPSLPASLPT
jgi:HD domain